jgi:hypothetical protein
MVCSNFWLVRTAAVLHPRCECVVLVIAWPDIKHPVDTQQTLWSLLEALSALQGFSDGACLPAACSRRQPEIIAKSIICLYSNGPVKGCCWAPSALCPAPTYM